MWCNQIHSDAVLDLIVLIVLIGILSCEVLLFICTNSHCSYHNAQKGEMTMEI
jgi:hypothetical protein